MSGSDHANRRTVLKALGGAGVAGTAGTGLSFAQEDDQSQPSVVWEETVTAHLDITNVERAAAMVSEAGGTVIAGVANQVETDKFWLQRRDGDGDVVWSSTYGGEASAVGGLVSVGPRGTENADGYAVVGSVGGDDPSDPVADGTSARIVKVEGWSEGDGDGGPDTDWTWTDDGDADSGFVAATEGSAGLAAAGRRDGTPYLVAFDENGDARWTQTYDLTDEDVDTSPCVYAVVDTGEGDFAMLVGYSSDNRDEQVRVVIADGEDGEREEVRSYDADAFRAVVRAADTYAFAGWTADDSEETDYLLATTDGEGERQWTRTYGGPTEEDADTATDVVLTGTGYLLGGERRNADGDERSPQLIHADRNGEERWAIVLDDTGQFYRATAVVEGFVYVLGTVARGDDDSTKTQPTLWKLAADDVVVPEADGSGENDVGDGGEEDDSDDGRGGDENQNDEGEDGEEEAGGGDEQDEDDC